VKTVLELACGTGTNATLLAKHGLSVVGTDVSGDMIARARAKAPALDFRQQDMRDLDVAARPFDAAICLFDSLGFLRTNEDIVQVLQRVRAHLHSRGLFVFEFWHAPAMLQHYEPVRVRKFDSRDGCIVRVSETSLDVRNSLANVRWTFFDPQPGGGYLRLEEIHTNRYFLCAEVGLLGAQAGFEVVSFLNGFSDDTEITASTWHVLAVLRALA
jgi:SAM-dependent methyltransferase